MSTTWSSSEVAVTSGCCTTEPNTGTDDSTATGRLLQYTTVSYTTGTTPSVQYHEELARPWIPTVWLGYSGGAFGGGSNVVPPTLAHFGGRSDFDVSGTPEPRKARAA